MIAATRRWFRRNRTPIAVGVGLVGAGYLATQYVIGKINDARERMSSDRIAKENLRRRFEQNQEDCTFTVLALLPTATTNILEAMNTEQITYEIQQMKGSAKSAKSATTPPSIADTAMTEDDNKSSATADSAVHASQITIPPADNPTSSTAQNDPPSPSPSRPKKTKRELWNDLTISSITRAFTLVYTLALLTLFTRIQLNLLGRRSYLSSVISLASGSAASGGNTIQLENNDDDSPEHAYGGDLDTNHKYLAFSWWLLNRGWAQLSERVEAAVREVFGKLSPRESLTYEAFSSLALSVRKKVEGETTEDRRKAAWLPYLLPPRDLEDEMLVQSGILDTNNPHSPRPETITAKPQVRRLLDETSDLIESPVFHHVLTLCLDAGFANLIERRLAQEVFELPPPEDAASEKLQATRAVLLPRILSVLTRQAHVIGDGNGSSGAGGLPPSGGIVSGVPNEYLAAMEHVPDLTAFSAVVYSANWQSEMVMQQQLQEGSPGAQSPRAVMGQALGESADRSMRAEVAEAAASLRNTPAPERQGQGQGGLAEESALFVDVESEFENAWAKASTVSSS